MISGINLQETVDFILPNDKENPTSWKLGIISNFFLGQIGVEFKKTGKEMEMVLKLVQLGLKGWSNFNIEYKTVKEKIFGREADIVPIELIEKIPIDVIGKLSTKISEINKLMPDEGKNS